MTERKTIRQLRQEQGWTQADLAERLGASMQTVSRWERGQAKPTWVYRRRLATLFGAKVAEIAFGPVEEQP